MVDVRYITANKKYHFVGQKLFCKNLFVYRKSKCWHVIDQLMYVGMFILDLSKTLMCGLYYISIKKMIKLSLKTKWEK